MKLARGRQRLMRGMRPYTLSDMGFRRVEAKLEEQVREGLPSATPWWRWLGLGGVALAATAAALVFITREPVTPQTVDLPQPKVELARATFRPLTVIRAKDAEFRAGSEKAWSALKPGDVLNGGEAVSAGSLTLSDEKAEWTFVAQGAMSFGGLAASVTLGAGSVGAKVSSPQAPVEVLASNRQVVASDATFQVTRVGAEVVVTVTQGEVEVVDSVSGLRRKVKAPSAVRFSDGAELAAGREEKIEATLVPSVPAPPWVRFDTSSLAVGTAVSLDGAMVGSAPFVELVTTGRRKLGLQPPNGALTESWVELVGGDGFVVPKVELAPMVSDGPEPDAAALQRVMVELKRQTPKLSACYEKWLKANPNASGEVTLELTVSAQGRVKKARLPDGAKGISAASAECLITTAKTLVLPPLGVEATLEQPLVLRPPGR
ncbi:MAG: AgmX/PglI C-terminal domain-containing protein [Archangium sp.]